MEIIQAQLAFLEEGLDTYRDNSKKEIILEHFELSNALRRSSSQQTMVETIKWMEESIAFALGVPLSYLIDARIS
ncbi:MAG: hypothetical protein WC942_10550 [Clostridia bacterium]|jgi:phage portal protein BeeE